MSQFPYFEDFGKAFVFKKIRPYIKEHFVKAGIQDVPYKFFGFLFYFDIILALLVYFYYLYPNIKEMITIGNISMGAIKFLFITFSFMFIVLIVFAIIIILSLYFYLDIRIYNRTKKIEELLPDYLQLVSTNLRGGMSFDKSLWSAIKPEFDILAKEIAIVSKKVMTGNDLGEALLEFSRKYDSPILNRSVDLIVGEAESGGRIADVIDDVILNIRRANQLKKEMATSTLTYMIFIGAIVIVIAPALFALSYQLIGIIVKFSSRISSSGIATVQLPINVHITIKDMSNFKTFSIISLSIISIFSSMIVSIINKGDIKGGIKYIPLFLFFTILLYLIFSSVLTALFAGMMI
ncbi:MAG: type II secretion system F family protein [Candidatus Woesearchaeota archaeon]